VAKIVHESAVIKSLWLEPADGKGIVKHQAGQQLPVRMDIAGKEQAVLRTYTLSLAPSDSAYRISVRRDGLFSSYFHDCISVDDVIEARAPQGNFTINSKDTRPVAMLAAGVGITLFTAMIRHLVYEGTRTRTMRKTSLFQAARTIEERAFDNELEELVAQSDGQFRLTRLLDRSNESNNNKKEILGRISVDMLKAVLPFDDYDFYLCGPPVFLETLYQGLIDMSIADKHIFFEAFGPAPVKRIPDGVVPKEKDTHVSEQPVQVRFSSSNKTAMWEHERGSLLELAEDAGLSPLYSCRMGSCGSCKTKIVKDKVIYDTKPNFPLQEGEAFICCAVPAAFSEEGNKGLTLDI